MLLFPNALKTTEKPWGKELLFPHSNEKSTVKIMDIKSGNRNSLHYHNKKNEIVHCLDGAGQLQVDTNLYKLIPNRVYFVEKHTAHRITAYQDLKILEVSVGEYDENDIVRMEDDYGRAS